MSFMNLMEFGPRHADHRRVSWRDDMIDLKISLPAPFHSLLACNEVPSSKEIDGIKRFRNEIQAKLAESMEQVRLLQVELERMKEDGKRLEKQLFACDTIRSPFRSLPNDVLYQIANRCPLHCHINGADDNASNRPTHFPMILSQISRSWRQTVHEMSNLWQNIRFICSEPGNQTATAWDHRLHHFSCLSRSLPLKIELDENLLQRHGKEAFSDENSGILRFLDHLIRYCSQNTKHLQLLRACSPRPVHILQHLESSASGHLIADLETCLLLYPSSFSSIFPDDDAGRDITRVLEGHPRLRHLWLGESHYTGFPLRDLFDLPADIWRTIKPAWSNLTRLSCVDMPFALKSGRLAGFLELCPALEVACFAISQDVFDPIRSDSFVHQNLKELGLYFKLYNGSMLAPFKRCRFPRVTSLQLQFGGSSVFQVDVDLPSSTIADVFPSIQQLVVSNTWGIYWGSEAIFPLITKLSTITDLAIICSDSHAEQFLEFIQKPANISSSFALPNLLNFHLQFAYSDQWAVNRLEGKLAASLKRHKCTRPSLNTIVECVVIPQYLLQGYQFHMAAQADMLDYFKDVQSQLFEDNDVELQVRMVEMDWGFPVNPLREHFLTLFQ